MEIVSKSTEHPMDLIVRQLSKQSIKSLKEQSIDQESAKEEQVIEVSHSDFVFENRLLILEDCDLPVQSQQLMHLTVRLHSKAGFKNRKKWQLQSTLNWKKRSYEASMPCKENGDQPTNHKFSGSLTQEDFYRTQDWVLSKKGISWCKRDLLSPRVDQPMGPANLSRPSLSPQPIQLSSLLLISVL